MNKPTAPKNEFVAGGCSWPRCHRHDRAQSTCRTPVLTLCGERRLRRRRRSLRGLLRWRCTGIYSGDLWRMNLSENLVCVPRTRTLRGMYWTTSPWGVGERREAFKDAVRHGTSILRRSPFPRTNAAEWLLAGPKREWPQAHPGRARAGRAPLRTCERRAAAAGWRAYLSHLI